MHWQPTTDLRALRARAELLAAIRSFFAAAGVLEVETPLCSQAIGTDPALAPLQTCYQGPGYPDLLPLYLQTSPEFAMKRLLAAGSGPIYQLCKAFRDGESGRRHNPEFSILEWYRPGYDHHRLMDEVADLLHRVLDSQLAVEKIPYRELFRQQLDCDPLEDPVEALAAVARREGINTASLGDMGRDAWLDLLMTHCLEAQLGRGTMTFVYDYPASQAALARLNADDPRVAARFELYVEGLELANGFHELTDATEQRRRFEAENRQRREDGLPELPIDERLLAALENGMPDCAGVALGVDRLLMLKTGAHSITGVISFPLERA